MILPSKNMFPHLVVLHYNQGEVVEARELGLGTNSAAEREMTVVDVGLIEVVGWYSYIAPGAVIWSR